MQFKRKKLIHLVASLAICIYTLGTFAADKGIEKSGEKDQFLFVHTAADSVLIKDKGKSNSYHLIMNESSPNIAYFNEKGLKAMGFLTINAFAKMINSDNQNKRSSVVVLESHDSLEGAEKTKFSKFIIEIIPPIKVHDKTIDYHTKILASDMPLDFQKIDLKQTAIFIDSVCASCIPGNF